MSTANPTTLLQEYLHLGHLNVTNRIKIKCQQKRFYQDSPLLFFHVMFSSVYSVILIMVYVLSVLPGSNQQSRYFGLC